MSQNDTFKFLAAITISLFSFGASATGTPWSYCIERNMEANGFSWSMHNITSKPDSFASRHVKDLMEKCSSDPHYIKVYDLGEVQKSKVQQQIEEASDEALSIREG